MASIAETCITWILTHKTLPEAVYYHGTSDSLNIGAELQPPAHTSKQTEVGRKKNLDKVFFTDAPKYAGIYARKAVQVHKGKPVVYTVEPIGDIETITNKRGSTVYAARRARVMDRSVL
jgi:hypothetical protein